MYRDESYFSRFINCKVNIADFKDSNSNVISTVKAARNIDPDSVAKHYAKEVVVLIPQDNRSIVVLAIQDIMKEDSIGEDTVINGFTGITKKELLALATIDFPRFLADIFIYALSYTDNIEGLSTISELNDTYIAMLELNKHTVTLAKPELRNLNDLKKSETVSELTFNLPCDVNESELVEEVGKRCPIVGCGTALRYVDKNIPRTRYGIMQLKHGSSVQTGRSQKNSSGYIALCDVHFNHYKNGARQDEWEELRRIKHHHKSRRDAHNGLFNLDICAEVRIVLGNFDKARHDKDGKGKCKPKISIEEYRKEVVKYIAYKFEDQDSVFFETVQNYVVSYFEDIDDVIRRYGRENLDSDSESLRTRVKDAYQEIRKGKYTQEEMFNELVSWLMNKTESSQTAICSIVISYYIRLCDVFESVNKQAEGTNEPAK